MEDLENFNKILKKLTNICIFFCYQGLLLVEPWFVTHFFANFPGFVGNVFHFPPGYAPARLYRIFIWRGLSPQALITRRH